MDIQPKSFKGDYETTFILKPELSEEERKAAAEKFIQLIKDDKGEIISIENWGMRKLAYTIRKKNTGYYTFVEFRADPESIKDLDRQYRYDENILRWLTVKLDKHALAYNTRRREQGFGIRKELKN